MKKILTVILLSFFALTTFGFEITNDYKNDGCDCVGQDIFLNNRKIYNYKEAAKERSRKIFGGCTCGNFQIGINGEYFNIDEYDDAAADVYGKKPIPENIDFRRSGDGKVKVKIVYGKILKKEYSAAYGKSVAAIQNFQTEILFREQKKVVRGIVYWANP